MSNDIRRYKGALIIHVYHTVPVADPGLSNMVTTYYLAKIFWKLHENIENWAKMVVCITTPPKSTTVLDNEQ